MKNSPRSLLISYRNVEDEDHNQIDQTKEEKLWQESQDRFLASL
jgi:hypothetical protein